MSNKIEGPRLTSLPPNSAAEAAERRPRASSDEKVGAVAAGDSVRLTDVGSELAAVARSAGEPAPVDIAKVAALRSALADGSFRVDSRTIADRLIAAEKDMTR
jgi:negative regulator of flagellin synthesis FlgM